MLKTIFILLLWTHSYLYADETKHEDRKISVQKSIDAFGALDLQESEVANSFAEMFSKAELSGQFRSIYDGYEQKSSGVADSYATAVGGAIKYNLAPYKGFHVGLTLSTSQDISFLTGDVRKHNSSLSSGDGSYTALSESYLDYENNHLILRFGRQYLDTPLADTDDSSMIANSFEAYMLYYTYNNFSLTLGNLQKFQGAGAGLGYDSNGDKLSSKWLDLGSDGIYVIGLDYISSFEFNLWYYDISKKEEASKVVYFDIGNHSAHGITRLHYSAQYLSQREDAQSAIAADIYGALVELVVDDIGFNIAYNEAKRHAGKQSFSGYGGGTLYTNMDTMTLDAITQDAKARAYVLGMVYELEAWNFLYAYGDFSGEKNSAGVQEHVVEHNIALEYHTNDTFTLAAIYVNEADKINTQKTANDWQRFQLMLTYNF